MASRAAAGDLPSIRMEPLEIELRPAMALSSVDLPQPEAPSRLTNSPAPAVSDRSWSTGRLEAYRLLRLVTQRNGAASEAATCRLERADPGLRCAGVTCRLAGPRRKLGVW